MELKLLEYFCSILLDVIPGNGHTWASSSCLISQARELFYFFEVNKMFWCYEKRMYFLTTSLNMYCWKKDKLKVSFWRGSRLRKCFECSNNYWFLFGGVWNSRGNLVCSEIHLVSCIAQREGTIWLYCNLFNYAARSIPLITPVWLPCVSRCQRSVNLLVFWCVRDSFLFFFSFYC